jgi:hypothetical protein
MGHVVVREYSSTSSMQREANELVCRGWDIKSTAAYSWGRSGNVNHKIIVTYVKETE